MEFFKIRAVKYQAQNPFYNKSDYIKCTQSKPAAVSETVAGGKAFSEQLRQRGGWRGGEKPPSCCAPVQRDGWELRGTSKARPRCLVRACWEEGDRSHRPGCQGDASSAGGLCPGQQPRMQRPELRRGDAHEDLSKSTLRNVGSFPAELVSCLG